MSISFFRSLFWRNFWTKEWGSDLASSESEFPVISAQLWIQLSLSLFLGRLGPRSCLQFINFARIRI